MESLKIKLRQKDGKIKTYEQQFVPLQKLIDAADLNDHASEYKTQVEWIEAKLKYVAGLFDDREVTAEAMLKGIDARESLQVVDDLINQVMGLSDPNSETANEE
ncbi:phage tail assembly chaperone G [Lacticaseibacillus rhamnosus]|uniref:phage tail assembly chaperone G n=1 Tax=Lacticaseibacillus rhamnosus TaxID=47715 RepID=UPI00237FC145|nr:hypothetical protein [Lacticaseibacillus rhamnosus]MDE3295911.1 hypothetical protein [Lacticaseibacillus rhamnosus]